jgi:hypothetical protein
MEQWRLEGSVVGGIAFFVALLLMLLIWMPTAPFFGHLRQGIQIACVSPLMAAPATIIVGTLIWAAIAWSFPTLLIVSLLGGAVILWGELIYLTVVAVVPKHASPRGRMTPADQSDRPVAEQPDRS